MNLSRPVAIVTGAARGIGRACATALVREGFNVILNDRGDADAVTALNELAEELAPAAISFAADIADLGSHAHLVECAYRQWQRFDCLVNNAGVGVMRRGDLLDVTPESFDRCISVNTRAVFFLTQAAARRLLADGAGRGYHRSIVNITSSNAKAVSITRGEYCVSKCASSMTTQLFGVRLAQAGIGVYEIRPGIIETEMTLPVKEKYDRLISEGFVPANRWGYPADVAATVCAMATGRLPYLVGQSIAVDGGMTIPRF